MSSLQIMSAAFIIIHRVLKNRKKLRKRRWWMTNLYRSRNEYCDTTLLEILRSQEISGRFKNFTRMAAEDFENLINLVGPKIMKKDTTFRKSIPIKERLAVTLRFLATGDSYTSSQYLFKISKQVICLIVPEVCEAITEALKGNIQIPTTSESWLAIANEFENLWNFPHCLGAIDGKHVVLQAPINSGSEFYNYKSTFSIVLFALVDAKYNFLFVDVGCQGRISDGGVFRSSQLNAQMEKDSLNFPSPTPLKGRIKRSPYFLIGDEAFPLQENVLKVYSGMHPEGSVKRIDNYRLCRARRVVENVFGIVSSVFRVPRKPMLLEPKKAELIVMAIVHLHNYLRRSTRSPEVYTPPGTFDSEVDGRLIEGSWRNVADTDRTSLLPIRNMPRRSTFLAKEVRDEVAECFCRNDGRVSWQNDYA